MFGRRSFISSFLRRQKDFLLLGWLGWGGGSCIVQFESVLTADWIGGMGRRQSHLKG